MKNVLFGRATTRRDNGERLLAKYRSVMRTGRIKFFVRIGTSVHAAHARASTNTHTPQLEFLIEKYGFPFDPSSSSSAAALFSPA